MDARRNKPSGQLFSVYTKYFCVSRETITVIHLRAMESKTDKPKRGRPYTGGSDPVRTIRVGPVWVEAKEIARARGVPFATVVTELLTRYVARNRTTS